jgi:hypothetical protein
MSQSDVGYDEREWDASLPETAIEEIFACAHILYRLSGCVDKVEAYKFVDKWLLSPSDELQGVVPMQMIMDGEGLVVLEYLRDVELGKREQDGLGSN